MNSILKNKGRKILGVGLILITLVFVLLIPVSLFSSKDPLTLTDYRVKAVLTDDNFALIKNKVRGGNLVHAYQAIKFMIGLPNNLGPILMIRETSGAEPEIICVTTGYICGGLCGQGVEYYLYKTQATWEIASQGRWVA